MTLLAISEKNLVLANQLRGLFWISPTHMNLRTFQWVDLDGPTACKKLVHYYREAVHWKEIYLIFPQIIVVELLLLN